MYTLSAALAKLPKRHISKNANSWRLLALISFIDEFITRFRLIEWMHTALIVAETT